MIVLAGGENIRPDMVESALARGAHIREVAVLKENGRLVALIVPKLPPALKHKTDPVEQLI
jgi:long-subunit acyl-CoA synthetase (AMP-forming)